MFRLWIGRGDGGLQQGPIFPTLSQAVANSEQLAVEYAVRIEKSDGSWHVFEGDATTIGPRFAAGTAKPGEPIAIHSLEPDRSERRRWPRRSEPLPELYTHSVSWNRAPVRLVDVSWAGARIDTSSPLPGAGTIAAIVVRAFGMTAQLAGRVRWARGTEFGLAFDETLMTRSASSLLERVLGARDAR